MEIATEKGLKSLLGDVNGKSRFARYNIAREKVVDEILPQILRTAVDLTDHGEGHVSRVMDTAATLIGLANVESNVELSAPELYCLMLSVLFHDVGNIFGREDHQHKVAEVYDYVFPDGQRDMLERRIVLAVTSAHCGMAMDGTKDTLKELSTSVYQLERFQKVDVCKIAAVLRFADELEEGPERTSRFMQKQHGYKPENLIHHLYADIVTPCIDRGEKRIALTYNINIETSGSTDLTAEAENKLKELLEYTYQRIQKLNQERKYNRFYCESILPYKETTVFFHFMVNGIPIMFDLPGSVVLNDLVLPGDKEKIFVEYDPNYKTDNVLEIIKKTLNK
jgi:hypothetical protein